MQVREEQLVKALTEMETIAKGGNGGKAMPKTTAEANGGLSHVGDKTELAAKGNDADDFEQEEDVAIKGGRKLGKWAKDDTSTSSSDDSDSTSKACKGIQADDDSDDDSSDDESSSDDSTSGTMAKKSTIADLIKSDAVAGPVVDVSSFVERLVDEVSEAEHELRKSVLEFQDEQTAQNRAVRKALTAMGNLVLEINNRMKGIEDAPAGTRKSILSKSEISERFEEPRYDFDQNQVTEALIELAQSGKVNPVDVTRYESTGTMENNVRKALEDHLRKSANA